VESAAKKKKKEGRQGGRRPPGKVSRKRRSLSQVWNSSGLRRPTGKEEVQTSLGGDLRRGNASGIGGRRTGSAGDLGETRACETRRRVEVGERSSSEEKGKTRSERGDAAWKGVCDRLPAGVLEFITGEKVPAKRKPKL